MALPALNIPEFPLPFKIPVDIHPCVIHLAVALPIVIVLMELVNLVVKKRTLGVFSFVLMVLLALVLFAAYLTGTVDAENAKAALAGDAKTLFEAHKQQGVYLVYGAAILVLIKLLSVLIRKTAMRVIFLIFLLGFTAMTVNTAKKGKELVFGYGINVKTAAVSAAPAAPAAAEAPEEKAAATPVAEEKKPADEVAPATAEAMKEEKKSEVKTEAPAAEETSPAAPDVTPEKEAEVTAQKPEEAATAPEAPEAPSAPETPAQQ
jgi:uncharacterized membrane protein